MTDSHLNEEAQKMAKLHEITRFGNQVVKIKFRPAKKLKILGFFGTPTD